MNLEDKSCEKCNGKLADGDVVLRNEGNFYHHSVTGHTAGLKGVMSCSLFNLDTGKIGIFYKDKFYDLEKNEDKLNDIKVSFFKAKTNEKGFVYGHYLMGNLSFLDNLEPD